MRADGKGVEPRQQLNAGREPPSVGESSRQHEATAARAHVGEALASLRLRPPQQREEEVEIELAVGQRGRAPVA